MHWIAKASAVVGRLSALWRKPSISRRTKMRIYNASVGSVLLYGAETWPATQSVLGTVNIAETKHLRHIKGLCWHYFVSNENLLALTAQTPFSVQLAQRTLSWYGHLLRMSPDTPARTIFDFNPVLHGGKRPRGRPPARWKDTTGAFLAMANIQEDVHILASDRSKWRLHVASLNAESISAWGLSQVKSSKSRNLDQCEDKDWNIILLCPVMYTMCIYTEMSKYVSISLKS